MFKAMMRSGCAVLLAMGAAGFNVPDNADRGGANHGNPPIAPPATQPAGENTNHEPGKVPGVQPRDPHADASLIDLTRFYTLGLNEDASGVYGYTLAVLPRSVQKLGNVQYDLRGIVQVSSQVFPRRNKVFPEAVKGITVARKCRTLSFLHASRWTEAEGTRIGSYVIHYADGQTREVPIVFGVDVRDWLPSWDPGLAAAANAPPVGWHGKDGPLDIVLYEKRWANPRPDVEVSSIDLVSAMTDAAPFLVALTAQ